MLQINGTFKKILVALFVVSVCVNLGLVDYWLSKNNQVVNLLSSVVSKLTKEPVSNGGKTVLNQETADNCGAACQEVISRKVKEEVAKIVTPLASRSTIVLPTGQSQNQGNFSQAKVVYVPVATYGAVSSMDWTDIVPSEFYFDLKDYPGAKEIRFVAYLLSINNDMGYARLYDNTNKRWAYFSDVQTNNSTFTRVESKPIEMLKGNNRFTIQLRSVNATQVQIKDAKLKIVF